MGKFRIHRTTAKRLGLRFPSNNRWPSRRQTCYVHWYFKTNGGLAIPVREENKLSELMRLCKTDCIYFVECRELFGLPQFCPRGKKRLENYELEACVACRLSGAKCRFDCIRKVSK